MGPDLGGDPAFFFAPLAELSSKFVIPGERTFARDPGPRSPGDSSCQTQSQTFETGSVALGPGSPLRSGRDDRICESVRACANTCSVVTARGEKARGDVKCCTD
jgi:hypothetical protein